MELFSRHITGSVLIMALMSCCSSQTTLGDQQKSLILGEVFQSLREPTWNSTNLSEASNVPDLSNVTNVSNVADVSKTEALNDSLLINVINKTLSEAGTDLPATIRAIIGFMATHNNSFGLDTVTGSQQTSNMEDNDSGSTLLTATNQTTETLALQPHTAATERTMTADITPTAHNPDEQIVDAISDSVHTNTRSDASDTILDDGNPIIQKKEEPVEPASPDDQAGLPLVLGATIVVVFVAGVVGATIKAKCRKRKLAKKERLSEGSGSDVGMERGLDNPAFIGVDKNNRDLSIMFNSHHKLEPMHMKYNTPTMPFR